MMMDHTASASQVSPIEYVLVIAAAIVLVWTLGLAIRYTVRPQESDAAHIKRRILVDEVTPEEEGRPR